jgi:AraC family cel operon transcriptional repressor
MYYDIDGSFLYFIIFMLYIIIVKTIALDNETFLPANTGANIIFHRLAWESGRRPESIHAGPDLCFHTLVSDATVRHTHDFAEFFLVIGGQVRHIVNSEVQNLQSGMLVFVRPNDVHGFEKLENSACELVNVAFRLEFLLDLSTFLGNDFFMRNYTGPVVSPIFKLTLAETEELALRLIRMNTLQKTDPDLARLKIKAMLAEIFTRFFLEINPGALPCRPLWFDKLCAEMKKPENLSGGLKTMLALAPCTQEHLCKCFRKYSGVSPTEFINEQRIIVAAKQIVETDTKILSVALENGFKSLSRFYQMFNKFYGVSPVRLRQMSRRNEIPV